MKKNTGLFLSIIGIVAIVGAYFTGYQVGQQNAEPPTIAEVFEETSKQVATNNEAEATETLELPTEGFDLSVEAFRAEAEELYYDDILRDPDAYVGKFMKKQGRVDFITQLDDVPGYQRLTVLVQEEGREDTGWPRYIYVFHKPEAGDKNILSGDTIEYGAVVMPLGNILGMDDKNSVFTHARYVEIIETRE